MSTPGYPHAHPRHCGTTDAVVAGIGALGDDNAAAAATAAGGAAVDEAGNGDDRCCRAAAAVGIVAAYSDGGSDAADVDGGGKEDVVAGIGALGDDNAAAVEIGLCTSFHTHPRTAVASA